MIDPGDDSRPPWASLPPGTVLDAVLETLDPRTLAAQHLIEAVAACERQLSHLHAVQARLISELSDRERHPTAGAGEGGGPARQARILATANRLGAVLAVGPGRAAERTLLALDLTHDLPATFAALDAGHVTAEKACIIASGTRRLSQAIRLTVEKAAVERAAELTAAQLRNWLDDAVTSRAREAGSAVESRQDFGR